MGRAVDTFRSVLWMWVLVLAVQANAESAAGPTLRNVPESVSLVRIIAAPSNFSDQIVTTAGVIMIEFEEDVLYLSREDAKIGLMLNGIKLIFTGAVTREYARQMNGKFVSIEGRFRVHQQPPPEITAGALTEITDIVSEDDWGRRE